MRELLITIDGAGREVDADIVEKPRREEYEIDLDAW